MKTINHKKFKEFLTKALPHRLSDEEYFQKLLADAYTNLAYGPEGNFSVLNEASEFIYFYFTEDNLIEEDL